MPARVRVSGLVGAIGRRSGHEVALPAEVRESLPDETAVREPAAVG
jgi:hypothetical protein